MIVFGIVSIIVSCSKKEEEAKEQKESQEVGEVERKISEAEEKLPRLSKKESQLLGKYLGEKNGKQLSFEIEEDGTALFNVSGGVWRVEWTKYRRSPVSYEIPTLSLCLYRSNGDACNIYCAARRQEEGYREIRGGITREDVFVSFWRNPGGEDHLQAQQRSNQITLNKVYSSEGVAYPGEVEIWERYEYISGPMAGEILVLERNPNYFPSDWRQPRGGDGKYSLCGICQWSLQGDKVKFSIQGKEESFELEIKDRALVDRENGIAFVKDGDSPLVLPFLPKKPKQENPERPESKIPKGVEIRIKEEKKTEIKITSLAFEDGGLIPAKYTCDGADISPPLQWEAVPDGTKSITLICEDLDALMGTFLHWVLFNLRPDIWKLPENITDKTLPNGAKQGITNFHRIGYAGPCPISGIHRYIFKIYALDAELDLADGVDKRKLLSSMEGHILGEGQLIGKYKR